MAEIFLVRHAQASFGAHDYDALSEVGHRQAEVLGEVLKLRVPQVDAVVCGSMRRHRQTADACLAAMGASTEVREDPGWNEYDHDGVIHAFEPRYRDREAMVNALFATDNPGRAFNRLFHDAVTRWVSGAEGDYAETFAAFNARVSAALQRVVDSGAQNAIVFTSGGAIMSVCRQLLQLSDEATLQLGFALVNGSITRLISGKRGVRLSSYNEHGHFAGERAALLTLR